jgi:hypothetical protein
MFLLLAAGAARADNPSGHKGLATYAIAMHGRPALPAGFSRDVFGRSDDVGTGIVGLDRLGDQAIE